MDSDGAMILLVLLTVVGVPLVLAIVGTKAPSTFALVHEEQHLEPPDIEAQGSEAYRGHAPHRIVTATVPESLNVWELPSLSRSTASMCRFAFIIAMVSIIPLFAGVMMDLSTGELGAGICLGVTGMALAIGQLRARGGILAGQSWGAARARRVGAWTLAHNAVVMGVIVAESCGVAFGHSDSTWKMFSLDAVGSIAGLYALISCGLGIALLRSSAELENWRAARNAI